MKYFAGRGSASFHRVVGDRGLLVSIVYARLAHRRENEAVHLLRIGRRGEAELRCHKGENVRDGRRFGAFRKEVSHLALYAAHDRRFVYRLEGLGTVHLQCHAPWPDE